MGKRIRQQASKRERATLAHLGGNQELAEAMRGFRHGSAAQPHRNKAKYNRRDRWDD